MPKKNKKSALAQAASRKLARIAGPRMSPQEIAHTLWHAEQRGEVQRVDLDDGSWGWAAPGPDGKVQILKPTPEMLAAVDALDVEGHPHEH